ncbi:DapH/DapD/GlmU-related protein [Kitasatospora sp. NPDC058162]|uniref:DapH/DapD/GlmU-related protein n=1 Tax=Kitasatospora sp. NPDC058162 TaxID=3346362 RepID=UPI0036DD786E
MADVVILGAAKFALEVARYVRDAGHTVDRFLALEGEEVVVPDGQWSRISRDHPAEGTAVVLAVSAPERRAELVRDVVEARNLDAINVVHPSSTVEDGALRGVGNVIGPDNYVGVNATFGSFNVLNYRSSIGHHSRIGSSNFISPNFHTGNSVTIGSGNFFGIGCQLAPGVTVGDDCRVQAGLTLFEDAVDGRSYLAPSRIKSLPTH